MPRFRRDEQCRCGARVDVVAKITDRIRLNERTDRVVRGERNQAVERLGTIRARGRERFGPLDEPGAAPSRPPLVEHIHRPRRLLVRVALRARVGDAECHGVLRRRKADRVNAHRRADADDGLRHVTFDARTALAVGQVAGVGGHCRFLAKPLVTLAASPVVGPVVGQLAVRIAFMK